MDLYEALKNGVSAENLLKTFHEDLDKATKRLTAEKEAEKQAAVEKENLAKYRSNVADAIINYTKALFKDEEVEFSKEEVEEALADFEKNIEFTLELPIFEKPTAKKTFKTTLTTDDEIIRKFLNTWK